MPAMTDPEPDLQRLLAEEGFVRELAQQLVVGEADDVVQQTWLRALQQGGQGVEQPRHWLARIVRNLAANLRRDNRRRRARHERLEEPSLVPSSAALAEREERRRALVAAVDALPPALRTVVLLRWFDGQPPRRIAKALGVSAAVVSTQLHRALALLRERLDARHGGDRRAWLVPLVPFAMRPELPDTPLPIPPTKAALAPALLSGAILMTTKTKMLAAAAAMVLGAGAWLWWSNPAAPADVPSPIAGLSPAEPLRAPFADAARAAPDLSSTNTARETATPTAAAATTGTVIVRVLHDADRTPAKGRMVTLQRLSSDPRFEGWRQRTDDTGTVRYEAVPPGRLNISDSLRPGAVLDLAAGQTAEVELQLEAGLTVTGLVVDAAKTPIAGAAIEVTMMARSDAYPEVQAITGADGRFHLRACPTACLVGARARGYTASPVKFLLGKLDNIAEVELVCEAHGGAVEGIVVEAGGKPVADAVVIVGAGKLSGIFADEYLPPFPALARSDADGRFVAVGVPAGAQPVQARADGLAPWTGTCEVAAGASTPLRITLAPGAIVRGHLHNAAGEPAARAEVEIGEWDHLAHYRTQSATDGAFEFTGLPVGDLQLRAVHRFGKAATTVRTTIDAAAICDLQLSHGLELKGLVVDAEGQPVPGALLQCSAPKARWSCFVHGDGRGAFTVANCPETGTIEILAQADGFAPSTQKDIDPRQQGLQLRLQRAVPSTVRILARVVGPDGKPVANARVSASREDLRTDGPYQVTDNDGRFELGPVQPGVWRIDVRGTQYPMHESEPRALAADATWDLGTITLVRGGTARLRLADRFAAGATFRITDVGDTRSWQVLDEAGVHRSVALAPGDYLLAIAGEQVAAMTVPFPIRAAEETVVDVAVQPGLAQRFVCELPVGARVERVSLQLRQGARPVTRVAARAAAGAGATAEAWLAPGEYRVFAEAGTLRGETTVLVDGTGAPCTVTLR